jgi:hypothetical protein
MLGQIRTVTISTPALETTTELYARYLGYRSVGDGRVSAELAALWQAPAEAGQRYRLMQPESGVPFWFRFVESPALPDYRALTTYGWNAAELMVQDVDALADRLADSPFEIIGPPADLSFTDAIRAMQVRGPAEEVLYLTQFKRRLEEFDTPDALSFVDRCFIVILGGPDLGALIAGYRAQFEVPDAPVMPAEVSVLSNALGLPADQLHDIAALPLAGQSFIEADHYPAQASERGNAPGRLPPAMNMVGFVVEDLDRCANVLAGEPVALDEPPYGGRVALAYGPAGERLELVERPAD